MAKLWQWIAEHVANIGQSIQFVAFWAHLGVGAILTRIAIKHDLHPEWVLLAIVIGGAIKEYWFDAREEKDPPQTFWDNTEDFVGWLLGPLVGIYLL